MNDVTLLSWQMLAWQLVQMTCLIGIAWLAIRFVGKNRPHFSHVVCLVVLAKCLLPPVWNHPAGLFPQLADRLGIQSEVARDVIRNENPAALGKTPSDNFVITPADEFTAAVREENSASPGLTESPSAAATPLGTKILYGWMASVALIGATAVFRIVRLLRSLRRSRIEAPAHVEELIVRLREQLGIRKRVRLLVTSERVGPAVIGFFRPVLVLPEAIVRESTPDDIEPILAHELLHIRRGDLWVGLLQMLAQIVWWFYPPVRGLNRILTREAERCCDEEVVAELGYSPARYARCLLNVLERKQKLQPVPAFPGVRAVELTKQRMERIMNLGNGIRKRTPWWCWVVGLGLCIVVLPGRMGVSEEKTAETTPSPVVTPVTDFSPYPLPTFTPSLAATPSEEPGILLFGTGTNSDAGMTGFSTLDKPTLSPITGSGSTLEFRLEPAPVRDPDTYLDKKIEITFNRKPLSDALGQLAREAELELFLDAEALKMEGLTINMAVNFATEKPTSIREILSQILKPHKLVFLLEQLIDEMGAKSSRLRVTTKAKVGGELVVMTYPVADLVVATFAPPAGLTDESSYVDPSVPVPSDYASPYGRPDQLKLSRMTVDDAQVDHESLMELIRKTIEPEFWDETKGVGTMAFYQKTLSLVVRHRRDVQSEIAELLSSLRDEQGNTIMIECLLFNAPDGVLPKECQELLDKACADSVAGKPLAEKTVKDLQTMIEHFDDLKVLSRPKLITLNNRGVGVQVSGHFDPATKKASADSFSLLIVPTMSADQTKIEMKLAVNAANTYDAISRLQTISADNGTAVLLDVTEGTLPHGPTRGVDEVTRRLQALEKKTVGEKRYLLLTPTIHREEGRIVPPVKN